MLGRPEIVVPVFMNVWAGSWLIASVTIERTMQMSSAMAPKCGNSEQISWPLLPNLENGCCGPSHLETLDHGARLAAMHGKLGLVVQRLPMGRPDRHAQVDHPLDPRRNV